MTPPSARRFLLAFATVFVAAVGLLLAHSLVVDPFGMWGTRIAPEKGYEKFGRVRVAGDRVVKALILGEDRFDAALIGSSRTLIGFDPAYATLAARRVNNAGFNGATTLENAGVIDFALARQSGLRDLVIGLDLFAFERFRTDGDYDQSGFAGASPLTGYAMRAASMDALDGSWRFWLNARKRTPQLTRDGFNHMPRKWLADRRRTFVEKISGGVQSCVSGDTTAALFDRNFARLLKASAAAKARGVNLHFYTSPQHVWAHFHQHVAGRAPEQEEFKRRLRAFADTLAAMPGAGRVALWDFDGLDAVTMEDVPPEGAGRDMRYFFEHSHFRTRTGDAIIAALLGGPDRIDGFGVRLDQVDVEAHLAATRATLAGWARTHPEDAEFVRARAMRLGACGAEGAEANVN